ncbi:NADH-quinone oxidoreductase subunit C [Candidatus Bathyarchaeota archaeon]|nr:NADH-quinone oxidoreductase subunit C [Candidatus Bathyarchaeota archaeon]
MSTLAKEQELVEDLKQRFGDKVTESLVQRSRRVFVTINSDSLTEVVTHVAQKGYRHVSTITGLDLGQAIGVIYHLVEGSVVLSLKTNVPKTDPKLPTIVNIILGAELYEREIHDMFGVVFEGHPDLSPLILPEKWPNGLYPLRKEWKVDAITAELDKIQE